MPTDAPRARAPLILTVGAPGDVAAVLRDAGFDVRDVATSAEALRVISEAHPPLVVIGPALDVAPPDLCRQVKSRPGVPFVIIVAPRTTDSAARQAGWDAGTDAHMTGEEPPAEIVAHVRALLRTHGAIEQARWSEERYRSLIESAPDAVLINQAGHVVFVNAAAIALFGAANAADLLGRPALDLFPTESHPLIIARLAQMASGRSVPLVENSVMRLDGSRRRIEVAAAPCYFGNAPAFQVVMRDITDVRENQNRITAFLNAVTESMWLFSVDGIVLMANATAARRLGRSVEDIVGRHWETLVSPAIADSRRQYFLTVHQTGRPVRFKDERDGMQFAHSFYPVTDEQGTVTGVAVFSMDVTEQQRAENTLVELSQRLSYHMDHGPVAVVEWGPDMRLTRWSVEAERLFGWKAEEVLGKRIEDFRWVHEEDAAQVDVVSKDLQTGVDIQRLSENRNYRKDGSTVYCQWHNSALLDSEGRMRSILSQIVDVTERRHLEEQLRQHAQDLERANRLKDEFLATLSHELRTPLNAVLGWLAMIKSGRLDPQAQRRALETVERNAQAQAQLISDILDISGIQAGKVILERQPVAVSGILEHLAETMRPSAAASQVRLDVHIDTGDAVVLADTARLQQIVWNLLSNAIKFTSAGGRVELRASATPRDVRIEVQDDGIGIEPDFMPFVFERFRQGDASPTRAHGGLGLGLAISKHLVELHGGTIGVESTGAGQGATFTVRLPRTTMHASDPAIARDRSAIAGLSVLVVDDHQDSRELLDAMLSSRGALVTTAESSHAAVLAFRASPPDVALIDIAMPGEDGYLCLARLRDEGARQNHPFESIAVTAAAREHDRVEAMRHGFVAHLAKPVHLDALVTAIAAAHSVRHPDSER